MFKIVLFILIFGLAKCHKQTVQITLLGAYGDLAEKYLWNGIFQLYAKNQHNTEFSIYAAGRENYEKGTELVKKIIYKTDFCNKISLSNCTHFEELFIEKVKYVQLKSGEHYNKHCAGLNKVSCNGLTCGQRIFYLSVPPFAYEGISQHISQYCTNNIKFQLKVVLEKPFGHDYSSAVNLSKKLSKHYSEDQIYR